MKRTFRNAVLLVCATLSAYTASAQRYTTEIFPSASVTSNVVYGNNITVIGALAGGGPAPQDLLMDVYTPAGATDTLAQRPLVIVMHTGSFLPMIINGSPTGTKTDSTIVALCTKFAKRGYVAAAMTYRLGWNPAATGPTGQDIRTGTLLQAVYRGLQDAKACVRYFRANADTGGNDFLIDPNNIILGGVGSGGYIALAYGTVDKTSEINLPKFLANTNDANYGFVAGQSYVNQQLLGDFEGYGGIPQLNNPNNSPGYNSDVQFIFNMGGAIGDTSWMEAGDPPMVAFHVVSDPFAPYDIGDVIVPTTGDFVVEVGGSRQAIGRADSLGNNACFANAGFTDAYTTYANTVNEGFDGLYPFLLPGAQAGPWEWYDSLATVFVATNFTPPPYNATGPQVYSNALLTNPDMSKAKAIAYIDTVMEYLNPRINYCLNLTSTGLNTPEFVQNGLILAPNPMDQATLVRTLGNEEIRSLEIFDVTGKRVLQQNAIGLPTYRIERDGLDAGVYLIQVETALARYSQRLVIR